MIHKKDRGVPTKFRYTPDIQGYKDAVWDFLMEHSDLTERGSIFVKFHIGDRRNFENRVLSRWRFNYHREDPRIKAELAGQLKQASEIEKAEARKRWEQNKERGHKILERRNKIKKITQFFSSIWNYLSIRKKE